jgi:uncharacterized hydrophobic protein (TIGR00341 family)
MMRWIDLEFPGELSKQVKELVESVPGARWFGTPGDGSAGSARVLAQADASQKLLDDLQDLLESHAGWRIVVLPVEAALLPESNQIQADETQASDVSAMREEIYQDVSMGTRLNTNFLVLTVLSSVVAAIGMNTDNIAVVIGAMVIAPLLGPLLALSFGSALGDAELMWRSTRTALAGLAAGFMTALLLGWAVEVNLASGEILDRTHIGVDSVILALASGGAAALSIMTGLSSTLVGVMVAVALLPPSVAVAMLLGAGEFALAGRAAALLATNVVCVNIASLLVFTWQGVRPRTWLEKRSAKRSSIINLSVWGGLLAALLGLIFWLK